MRRASPRAKSQARRAITASAGQGPAGPVTKRGKRGSAQPPHSLTAAPDAAARAKLLDANDLLLKMRGEQVTDSLLHGDGEPARWRHPYYWAPFVLIGNGR